MLIINADDWGRSREETDSALDCFRAGRLTSVSAMVFMPDSERAARVALETGIDVGLHFNLTERYCAMPATTAQHRAHDRIVRFLRLNRYMWLVYNPLLRNAVRVAWEAQLAEFQRLYGRAPSHVDGHQHMHLWMNVLCGDIIPRGTKVRRTFSFGPGERNPLHRACRSLITRRLDERYRITDYFFCIGNCIQSGRLGTVVGLAKSRNVELMSHPVRSHEKNFILSPAMLDMLRGVQMGSYSDLGGTRERARALA